MRRRVFLGLFSAGLVAGVAARADAHHRPGHRGGPPTTSTTTTTTLGEPVPTFTASSTTVRIPAPFVYDVLVLASDSNATAQSKIDGAASNAVVGFEAGVHAERKVTGRLGQTYRGDPRGTTVFDGSRLVTGWSGSNPWVASHTIADRGVFIDTTGQRTAVGDDVGSQYPEELFFETPGQNTGWTRKQRQGQPSTTAPSAGKWTISYVAGTLRVAEDPTGVNVRTSVTDTAIVAPALAAGGLVVEDITFQKYATDIFHSAAGHGADHRDWLYRRVAMLDCHGDGFYLGPGDVVTNCRSCYNGFDGFENECEAGGYVAGQQITNSEVAYNKQARYRWDWGGGGSKFDTPTSGIGLLIRNCWWHHNWGPALWLDINTTETSSNLIESNLFEHNEITDIFLEITNGTCLVRWNRSVGTGDGSIGNNGGSAVVGENAAIDVSNSRGCTIQQNVLDVAQTGLIARDDDRSPTLDSASFQDNSVKTSNASGNANIIKIRPGVGGAPIATCGADSNRYWTGAPFNYNNTSLNFAGWQAARTGPGLTGALDPNGTGGLSGSVTDPSTFHPFELARYGPGV